MGMAAIYARVSSQQQKEEETIASQTAALREFADSLGLGVPGEWIFEDEGFSGATLLRPALERLRDLVAQAEVEVVLCHSPDRLARKYAYQALLVEEFTRAGTVVRFLKGPKADTPEDELLLQFQGMIAEYEKAQIAERTRRGRLYRARSGAVSALACAPYGYCYVRKGPEGADARYEIVESKAMVVREIFRRYTEEGVTLNAIARRLNEQGIPTAAGNSFWDSTRVWRVLRNPAYCGRAAFGKKMLTEQPVRPYRKRRGVRSSRAPRCPVRERPREQWIEISVPPIVSEAVFEIAQRRLEHNKRFATRRTKEPSLLQGMLTCRSCGYAYYRTSAPPRKNGRIYYYRCGGSHHSKFPQGIVCHNPPLRQDALDALVWEHVVELLSQPELVGHELDRRLRELRTSSPVQQQKSRLELELNKVRTAQQRLLAAYQEELLSLDELRSRMPELRRKESSLRSSLDVLQSQIVDQETYLALAENLQSFLARLRDAADVSSVPQRQRVLRLLVKEILLDAERITIRHSIPSVTPRYPLRFTLQRA